LTRYRSILAASCSLALLVASGCTENPPASTLPPPSTTPTSIPSATPSQTPKPRAPVMPAAATSRSKAGLEAFGRYWLASEAYLQRTGDAGPYLGSSAPQCEWCSGVAKIYVGVYRAGGRYEGDLDLEIRQVSLAAMTSEGSGTVEFRGYFPPSVKVAKAGAAPTKQKSALVDYALNADYVQGKWRVESAVMNVIKEGI